MDVLSVGEARLNTLLFVPLGLFTVMAYRRPLAAVVAGFLGSVTIEAAQLAINDGRQCDLLDVYANTTGTVVGVALGCLLLLLLKRRPLPTTRRELLWAATGLILGGILLGVFHSFTPELTPLASSPQEEKAGPTTMLR
ncbi:VanZ family protein [Streptomyces sp. NBC_00102]|uniref:VanZ family protein n=1 Tax=Streptomyces sp. NBC_00102 TaxID=2975652 RepID=UPI0022599D76|nr:VanZ family protein [Streptomyces sp. NBC_00102]MCX5401328.1 VanZ family protein [Streptomyces sp. NBC_00102]